jgi:hypothetical protein
MKDQSNQSNTPHITALCCAGPGLEDDLPYRTDVCSPPKRKIIKKLSLFFFCYLVCCQAEKKKKRDASLWFADCNLGLNVSTAEYSVYTVPLLSFIHSFIFRWYLT